MDKDDFDRMLWEDWDEVSRTIERWRFNNHKQMESVAALVEAVFDAVYWECEGESLIPPGEGGKTALRFVEFMRERGFFEPTVQHITTPVQHEMIFVPIGLRNWIYANPENRVMLWKAVLPGEPQPKVIIEANISDKREKLIGIIESTLSDSEQVGRRETAEKIAVILQTNRGSTGIGDAFDWLKDNWEHLVAASVCYGFSNEGISKHLKTDWQIYLSREMVRQYRKEHGIFS